MAIKIKDLIKKLKEKDQNTEVEFIVVDIDGKLVCAYMQASAKAMADVLKMFAE